MIKSTDSQPKKGANESGKDQVDAASMVIDSSPEEGLPLQETQPESGTQKVVQQEEQQEEQQQQSPESLKSLPLAATLFNDTQTPWINKIKDPFKETPVSNGLNKFIDTPKSVWKSLNSIDQSPINNHIIFNRLRECKPELEVESQSQLIKEMLENPVKEELELEEKGTIAIPSDSQDLQVPGTIPEQEVEVTLDDEIELVNSDNDECDKSSSNNKTEEESVLNFIAEDSMNKYKKEIADKEQQRKENELQGNVTQEISDVDETAIEEQQEQELEPGNDTELDLAVDTSYIETVETTANDETMLNDLDIDSPLTPQEDTIDYEQQMSSSEVDDDDAKDLDFKIRSSPAAHSPAINTKRRKKNNEIFPVTGTPSFTTTFPTKILRAETADTINPHDYQFKNNIWYLLNTRLYPGIIIDEVKSTVKFLDTIEVIKEGFFYPLDVRIGDIVKIFNNDKLNYQVTGLECTSDDMNVIRCVRGYDKAYLKPLVRKRQATKSQLIAEGEEGDGDEMMTATESFKENEISLPIEYIVMENDQWFKFDRISNKFIKKTKKKIFEGCAFTITGNCDKVKISRLIEKNGGEIIENGFSSLISLKDDKVTIKNSNKYSNYQFAAVISSNYCRKRKYLETLALGWPLLHENFIFDCELNNEFENFEKYLLCSGDSVKFNCARSSVINNFINNYHNGLVLNNQLKNNLILNGEKVLYSGKITEIERFLILVVGGKLISIHDASKETGIDIDIKFNETLLVYNNNNNSSVENCLKADVKRKIKQFKYKVINWEWLVQLLINYGEV